MIRPGAIVMTVLMSAVAVGVYFGLDYLPKDLVPGMSKQEEPAALPSDETPLVEGVGTAVATSQVDRLASGAEDPIAPSAVVTEEDLAEEPPAPAPAPAAAAAPSAASTVDYDPPAGGAGVPVEEDETASAPPAASAPAPAAPAAKAAPQATPPKAPAAEQPATVAGAAPASEPARQPVKPKGPEADIIKPWWPDPATMPVNQLKLQYAGQVQNEQAIALLFSAPLNLATLNQHTEVRDATGFAVTPAQWELSKNPRMAVLRGLKPGRYTVILAPAVADAKGFALGARLQGPVYIQAQ